MPEMLEVETYRRLAERALGRRIVDVDAPDPWFLKGGATAGVVADAMVGRTLAAARRRGKLLLLDVTGGPTVGLRFGMTGVLELDGDAAEELLYASHRREPAWVRLRLAFVDGGALVLRDARRLGGVELEPAEELLGPDAASVTRAQLAALLSGSRAPLKARLMDQRRLAGLGNLLTDELLWRAGLDPARAADSLTPTEVRSLHANLRRTIAVLGERGGSHTGDLQASRERGARCPKDGAELLRRTIGGRTTYSCPVHQR
jgi:formamidopyrimidine-DNA glycosylase